MGLTLTDRIAATLGRRFPTHPTVGVPEGSVVELPGRGSTFVTDSAEAGISAPDAPPVMLLHSVMTTGLLTWYPTLPELSRRFRAVTMDQRWHGRGISSEHFSLDDCADDVVALADVLGIDRFVAAGFSMGGGIAQLVAHRHPDRVSGLVLAATGPFFGNRTSGHRALDGVTRLVTRHLVHRLPGLPSEALDEKGLADGAWALRQVRSGRLSRMDEIGDGLGQFDSREWLSDIAVPTAVCLTTADRVVPPSRQQLLLDGIPGAVRVDVPAGHACCVLEPTAFVGPFVRACEMVSGLEPIASDPAASEPPRRTAPSP
ncbi:alpha/beta fold hydrolase [Williamsia deligens]|uniref:Alpha/beta fold hydrolase n=1 Tax=Williamsia deligens TaxID=321325 RepID=A0ABW3G4D8_9NOCA|nr:alpha/beta fold hydrolase [Williamsia deligens]MCP2194132.1 Pimeloyl-ACP methyl ester carboxylesterase [Williamsia deligens]